ncbi:MAG: hypothetical protein Q4E65_05010 [Clostridia bacterium]|nr:hypothetical protein [Clostridia bacterium]
MKNRADGVRVNANNPMYEIIPYIMDKRYDSQNMVTLDIPVGPMDDFLRQKRREGTPLSHLALVICAYLRATAEYPALNRFVVNRRIYARKEFTVGMVVLKPGVDQGTMNKMFLELTDDVFDVQRKIDAYVAENRQTGDHNKTDDIMAKLLRFPALCGFIVNILKWADLHNLLPKSVIDASPFHESLVITNLASIRTNHIYHHLYEFGTVSLIVAMGNLREVAKRVNGTVEHVRCLPLGCVMDERICSGSYYALCFSRIRAYLADPSLMVGPPKVVHNEAAGVE